MLLRKPFYSSFTASHRHVKNGAFSKGSLTRSRRPRWGVFGSITGAMATTLCRFRSFLYTESSVILTRHGRPQAGIQASQTPSALCRCLSAEVASEEGWSIVGHPHMEMCVRSEGQTA